MIAFFCLYLFAQVKLKYMNKLKFGWEHYWTPTPKGIRKLADSLLAGAITVSTFAFVNDHPAVATVIMIVAGIAKFASNFFSEDTSSTN